MAEMKTREELEREIERVETGMFLTFGEFRELLENLGIEYKRFAIYAFFKDIETEKELHAYPYLYKKPDLKKKRKRINPPFPYAILNGHNVDLVSKYPYKEYTINVKVEDYEEFYIFNTFETFELSSNSEYVRTTLSLKNDKIEVVEKHGTIKKMNEDSTDFNYVVNNVYRITAQGNGDKRYISVKDETDERLEHNEERFTVNTLETNGEITTVFLADETDGIENGMEIIENNGLFKKALKAIYPSLFELYQERAKKQKQMKI